MTPKKTTLSLSQYELWVLDLALRGYLDGLDGNYDNDHIAMENLRERIRHAQQRLKQ